MNKFICFCLLLGISLACAGEEVMLNQEEAVVAAITAAAENDLGNFVRYVRLMEVYGYDTQKHTPYKLVEFFKEMDPETISTELKSINIVVVTYDAMQFEFTVRLINNRNIRDEKQYVISRIRQLK